MHIRLPVFYKIDTRMKHQRSSQNVGVYQYADFDLTEITNDMAPVAIQGFDRNNKPYIFRTTDIYRRVSEKTEYPTKDSNPTGILRYYNDELWYPEYGLGDNLLTPEDWSPFNSEDIMDHEVEKRYWDRPLYTNNERWNQPKGYSPFNEDEHRNITSSTFQESYDLMARDLADNVVIIDGYVYAKTPEPIYAVTSYSDHIGITTLFSPAEEIKMGTKMDFFKLDRYDDMIQHVDNMIALKNSGENLSDHLSRIPFIPGSKPDVLITGLMNFKDEEYSMIRSAKNLIKRMEDSLKHLDREIVNTWFDLKEELQIADNSENIGQALFNLNSIISGEKSLSETENKSLNGYQIREAVKYANYALHRWNNKPIDLDLDFDVYNF